MSDLLSSVLLGSRAEDPSRPSLWAPGSSPRVPDLGWDEALGFAILIESSQVSHAVIGRLDRPTHGAKDAPTLDVVSMDHPIQSGDDGFGWRIHDRFRELAVY